MTDLFLESGALAGLQVSPQSPVAGSDLLAASSHPTPLPEGPEWQEAVQTLAQPTLVLAGQRGARRGEPWPFFVCRRAGGPAVLLAPEGGGWRLRFSYSGEELMDWLVGPFRRFAAPQIDFPEIPPLTPAGLAVMLAVVEIFGQRYSELDPDWMEAEPIAFNREEVMDRLAEASLLNGLARLGGPGPEEVSPETVESLLFLFCNEGYLSMEDSLFTMTESFLGTALSLAWWDLSLSLECRPGDPIRLIQGLALWRFVTGSDGRTRMVAISGEQLEAEVRGWLMPPRTGPSYCGKCGKPMKPGAKFCGSCGAKVASPRCRECSKPLDSDAKFCPQCGHPAE